MNSLQLHSKKECHRCSLSLSPWKWNAIEGISLVDLPKVLGVSWMHSFMLFFGNILCNIWRNYQISEVDRVQNSSNTLLFSKCAAPSHKPNNYKIGLLKLIKCMCQCWKLNNGISWIALRDKSVIKFRKKYWHFLLDPLLKALKISTFSKDNYSSLYSITYNLSYIFVLFLIK